MRAVVLLILGSCMLVVSLLLMVARQAEAKSPFLEFTSLEGDQWRYCRWYRGDDQVRCGKDSGAGWARIWSPTGQWGAFVGYQAADKSWHIYLQRPNSRKRHSLTAETGLALPGTPTWSPDGEYLAFSAVSGIARDLYRIRADGSELTKLTQAASSDFMPAWSPDGSRMAFVAEWTGAFVNLYVMNLENGKFNQVRVGLQEAYHPVWSPDGQWLLVETNRSPLGGRDPAVSPNMDIYRLSLDGRQLLRLTDNPTDDYAAAWSPDGEWIAYNVKRVGGGADVYLMRPDGSNNRRLTDGQGGYFFPIWSPVIQIGGRMWLAWVIGIGLVLGAVLPSRRRV